VPAPASIPPQLLQRHRLFNRNSEGRWNAFASHRAQMTALLEAAAHADGQGRLCVLGAGNCNDLDLSRLLPRFAQIHLCDLDEEALAKVSARQQLPEGAPLVMHAPLDLTGALPRLLRHVSKPPTPAELAALGQDNVDGVVSQLPGPFDVVVSACLLSQLMHTCRLALGPDNPALIDIANVMVIAHLRTALALTAPGGTTIIVTDTASSKTYPLVELWDDQPPLALLDQLERSDNVLSGTAPTYLRRLLLRDPALKPLLKGGPRLVPPWLWDLGDEVTLLAYALVMERA
jgi:hypothetical protein